MLIVALGMSLGGTTGYAINPARDLAASGARPAAHQGEGPSDWAYSWVPVVGPLAEPCWLRILYCLVMC